MSWCDSAAKTGKNIAVWWDMKDCPVPEGIDAHRVRPSIEGALKEQGYSGPVSITAYGDQNKPLTARYELSLPLESRWYISDLVSPIIYI